MFDSLQIVEPHHVRVGVRGANDQTWIPRSLLLRGRITASFRGSSPPKWRGGSGIPSQ